MLVLAALVIALASTGTTTEERDATAALLIGPLGLYMMFTKNYILYDGEPEEDTREEPEARSRASPARRPHPINTNRQKGAATWQGKESSKPPRSRAGRM